MSVLLDILAPTSEINFSTTGQETQSNKASLPHPGLYLDYGKIAVENTLGKENEHITYKRFRDSLTTKIAGETSDMFYQGIKLKNYRHYQYVEQIRPQ